MNEYSVYVNPENMDAVLNRAVLLSFDSKKQREVQSRNTFSIVETGGFAGRAIEFASQVDPISIFIDTATNYLSPLSQDHDGRLINIESTSCTQKLERIAQMMAKIDEAASDSDFRDEDDPEPTKFAIDTCKKLIQGCGIFLKGFRLEARVRPLNGSIRVTWTSSSRNVRLVCNPSTATPSYVYQERLAGRRCVEHSSETATTSSLAKWLRWMNRSA